MNAKLKKILKYLLSAGGAAVLLWLSFKGVDWTTFWQALKSCSWGFVLISMLIGVWSFFFRGLRWRELLRPIDPHTRRLTCFNAVNISYVVNMVLPRAGELARCGYITGNSEKDSCGKRLASYDKVFGTVFVDRLWDMLTMALVLIGTLLCLRNDIRAFFFEKMPEALSGKLHFRISWIVLLTVALLAGLVWACVRFRDRSRFCGKVYGALHGILTGIKSCLTAGNWWKTLLYSLLVWAGYWMTSYTILLAVQGMDLTVFATGPETAAAVGGLGVTDALFLMLVGAVSSLVPVPGGFGAFHYLLTLSLSAVYGIPAEIGLIFATLTHESQALIQLICGGLSYGYETVRAGQKGKRG